jgi:predicted RNA-binding Zn ribbon-like protein
MTDPTVLVVADFAASLANTAPWIWRDRGEHLPDVETLRRLLIEHGLGHSALSKNDVERARDLRDRLRAPFDAESDSVCAQAINELLAELSPVPHLDRSAHGWSVQLRCSSGQTIDDAAAAAAHALADLLATDGRHRLHHCAADACQGVFVDTTRNRSRRFCMPEICGNRTNVAAHRRRSRPT